MKKLLFKLYATTHLVCLLLMTSQLNLARSSTPLPDGSLSYGFMFVKIFSDALDAATIDVVQHALRPVLADPEISPYVTSQIVPFGRAYFASKECGGKGSVYNATVQHCWAEKCQPKLPDHPASFRDRLEKFKGWTQRPNPTSLNSASPEWCFSSEESSSSPSTAKAIYPEGPEQGAIEVIEGCSSVLAPKQALPFLYCVEQKHKTDSTAEIVSECDNSSSNPLILSARQACILQTCSQKVGIDWGQLLTCASQRGPTLEVEYAKETFQHVGYNPLVLINGMPYHVAGNPGLIKEVICMYLMMVQVFKDTCQQYEKAFRIVTQGETISKDDAQIFI